MNGAAPASRSARLRLAVWSPLPPSPSGIADYVAETLPDLARKATVELVVEELMTDPMLRALDVFLLTARRHDVPVIFTFFAFVPPAWGGRNPYFDPQSVGEGRCRIPAGDADFPGAFENARDRCVGCLYQIA